MYNKFVLKLSGYYSFPLQHADYDRILGHPTQMSNAC
jgi:hypothetical protein